MKGVIFLFGERSYVPLLHVSRLTGSLTTAIVVNFLNDNDSTEIIVIEDIIIIVT